MVDSFRKLASSTGKRGLGLLKSSNRSQNSSADESSFRESASVTSSDSGDSMKKIKGFFDSVSASANSDNVDLGYAELWDGLEKCIEHAWDAKRNCKILSNLLVQWAINEEHLGKSFPAIKKKMQKPKAEIGSLGLAWDGFVTSFDNLSFIRVKYSNTIAELGKELEAFRQDQTKEKKQLQAEGTKMKKEMSNHQLIFERAKQKYKKACHEADKCLAAWEKGTDEKMSVLEQKATESLFLVQYLENQYKSALEDVKTHQSKYNTEMKQVLQKLQNLEEARITFLKRTLTKAMEAQQESINEYQRVTTKVAETVNNIDGKKDIKDFVNLHIKAPMEPYTFEKFTTKSIESKLQRLKNDIYNSDTGMLEMPNPADNSMANKLSGVENEFSDSQEEEVKENNSFLKSDGENDANISECNRPSTIKKKDSSGAETESSLPSPPDLPETLETLPNLSKTISIDSRCSNENPEICYVRVLYDYETQGPDELCLSVGEIIRVVEKDNSGWWEGENEAGEDGLFPNNYTELIAPEEAVNIEFNSRRASLQSEYESESKDVIAQAEEDIIEDVNVPTETDQMITENDDEELENSEEKQEVVNSLFPCKPKDEKVIVLYDYEAEDEGDLNIKKDQVLFIHGTDNEGGWLDASDIETGQRGIVPSNYVASYQTAQTA